MAPVCKTGTQSIKYAWGRNAPSLEMPNSKHLFKHFKTFICFKHLFFLNSITFPLRTFFYYEQVTMIIYYNKQLTQQK